MEYYGNNDWRVYIRRRNELEHFDTPKHSGRYPWGSGENPYHHGADSPRKRYKARKAEIKKEWRNRRRELNDEIGEKEKEIDSHYKRGEALSKEHIEEQNKNTMDFAKKWDEARGKYKSDLKTAKEQYKSEKKQEKDEEERIKKATALVKELSSTSKQVELYNKASYKFNKRIDSINKRFPNSNTNDYNYVKAVSDEWKKIYSGVIDKEYKDRAFSLFGKGTEEDWENVKGSMLYYSVFDDMLKDLKK